MQSKLKYISRQELNLRPLSVAAKRSNLAELRLYAKIQF